MPNKPMRKTLAALLFISLVVPPVEALPIRQSAPPEKEPEPPKAKPVRAEGPTFLERLFSTGDLPRPVPRPAPKPVAKAAPLPEQPTVKPVAKPKPRRPAASVATGPKDDEPAKPKVEASAGEPVSAARVKTTPPSPEKVSPAATKDDQLPPPPKGKGTKGKAVAKKASTPPAKLDLTGMDDGAKFKAVKAQAAEDPEVKDLKSKADGEVDDAAAQKALSAYNRALFRKIREIEPSVTAFSERVEASMTKRVNAEKAKP